MSVEVEEHPVPDLLAPQRGDCGRAPVRHGLLLHRLPTSGRPPARPRPPARDHAPRSRRPSAVAQRRRNKVLLGLALLGTVPIVPLLGRWSVVSLTAITGCLVVTYLDAPPRP
ncbi:hypothetical protein AB0I60_30080 [Actinosynnema sp. NPDC050436]|uniref:hypothetical protein n=1 Tax=Actinosynnema sp. NPDC050436 TaxID=3155659 RepID=UPI0034110AA3